MNVVHVTASVHTRGEADNRYYTKAEVDAILANLNPHIDKAAVKQATLDSILVGDAQLTIDRAPAGQITLNAANPMKFEASGLYNFDRGLSNDNLFDKASAGTYVCTYKVSCSFRVDGDLDVLQHYFVCLLMSCQLNTMHEVNNVLQ